MTTNIDFSNINLPIPENVFKYSIDIQNDLLEYLQNLNEIDRQAYLIAYDHLGTTFHILRSNGFKSWVFDKYNLDNNLEEVKINYTNIIKKYKNTK